MVEKIKQYYDERLWSEARLRNLVELGKITKEDFKIIMGKEY